MELYLQTIVSGLLMGGVYALIAIGLTLIYGVMDIVNFAHGSFLMWGMFMAYWAFVLLRVDPYLSLIAVAAALFLIGMVVQRVLIKPVLDAPHHIQILLTIGLFLVMDNLALIAFGPDFRTIQVPYAYNALTLGSTIINLPRLIAFAGALLLTAALYLFLKKTDMGKAIRAASEQKVGARLVGINVGAVNAVAFGIGTACVGVAGTLITPFFYISPEVGFRFVLKAFVVVVMGGMGNFIGALTCGLLIGVTESLGAVFLSGAAKDIPTYAVFIVTLLFRPQGLFTFRRG